LPLPREILRCIFMCSTYVAIGCNIKYIYIYNINIYIYIDYSALHLFDMRHALNLATHS